MRQPSVAIRDAHPDEVGAAVAVQHRAFTRVARQLDFDPEFLPPVRETTEEVRSLIAESDARLLVAVAPGSAAGHSDVVVGTVRGMPGKQGSVEIGRLAVEDGWEGRGIGRALMEAAEAVFPDAERFELFTGKEATGPLHLYESMGYELMRDEEVVPGVHVVWLEKCRPRRVDSTT